MNSNSIKGPGVSYTTLKGMPQIRGWSSIRVSISSIYLGYLEIILLNHLFLIILKIRNHLLFVINIINLLEVQYSISINWLLILILIL